MALTKDVHIERLGVGVDQPFNFPLGASVTVYRGSFALTDAAGNLKNASNPSSTDKCWGLIQQAGPESVDTGPGIVNGSTVAGVVTADVATGTFFMASDGTLTQSNVGMVVYVKDEVTVSATASTRPAAGVLVYIETRPQAPGNYAIAIGTGITGPVGGP
jgi:hypothetical protein